MKTIRYDVVRVIAEIKEEDRFQIRPGCAMDAPEKVDSMIFMPFEVKEEALMELEAHPAEISKEGDSYFVTEYFVQENEYDEEGRLCGGGDILDSSVMEIEVLDRKTNQTLETYDNWKAAESAMERLSGEREVYLA